MRDVADSLILDLRLRCRPIWQSWRAAVDGFVQQERQLSRLRQLDDRLLRDVGISADEAMLGRPEPRRYRGGRP